MKKLIYTLGALLIFCMVGQAQSRNDLKGPKAKNYKVWKDSSPSATIVSIEAESVKGPAAKNEKAWSEDVTLAKKTKVAFGSKKLNLKGPKAKNYKPWK
ncbi:MAG: hypothetical protein ABJF11_14090 [Reichenbachiella sp.]|uniref:hypothetical protein n=1 Tax=Reichenbachiella sp. TaxID=2184521 RepID=UPI0032677F10